MLIPHGTGSASLCRAVREHWSEYLDQDLERALCAELEDHLRACPECRGRVTTMRQLLRLVQEHGRTPMPSAAHARLLHRLDLDSIQEDQLMISMPKTEIGIHISMPVSYENAIARVTAALKQEGFGVLTEIDVQATLKKKLGLEFQRYVILGACNPPLAHRALTVDLDVGLLLPCNVIVYETGENQATVGLVDPLSMLGVLPTPALEPMAQEARARLERVAKSLQS